MRKATIVISNWNGCRLLEESLPSVIEAIENSGVDHELMVVDDASSDGSVEFLKRKYPQVRVLEMKENQGFAEANNIGISASRYDIVIPLNNDMVLGKDYFRYILEPFDDDTVFAVSPRTIEEKMGKPAKVRGASGARFKWGFWVDEEKECHLSLTALGGGPAIDKKKFTALGGFDRLYRPFYYEDTDLCYRAWKRGWKIIYEPRAEVYHKCAATIRSFFSRRRVSLMKRKNYYLFMWKNITDRPLTLEHLFFLPFHLASSLITGRFIQALSFFLALRQLPEALAGRRGVREEQVLSDREILDLFQRMTR